MRTKKARPRPKPRTDRLQKVVFVRLNDEQWEKLYLIADNLGTYMSTALRQVLQEAPIPPRIVGGKGSVADPVEVTSWLRHAINQITHARARLWEAASFLLQGDAERASLLADSAHLGDIAEALAARESEEESHALQEVSAWK